MGINLLVAIPHSLDAADVAGFADLAAASSGITDAATSLHDALTPRWAALGPLERFARIHWSEDALTEKQVTAQWAADRWVAVHWAGFTIGVGRRTIAMTHIEKFGAFLDRDLGLQMPLRRACRAFASLVGGREALYGADSSYPTERVFEWALEGMTFGAIIESLTAIAGPPATELSRCDRGTEGVRTLAGWFIDRFDGLPRRQRTPDTSRARG
jgi:hypothetical protein